MYEREMSVGKSLYDIEEILGKAEEDMIAEMNVARNEACRLMDKWCRGEIKTRNMQERRTVRVMERRMQLY